MERAVVVEPSELIITPNGRVYHLDLTQEELAQTILLVGDPARSARVATFFSTIEVHREHREFISYTGTYNGQRLSVISTGIGCDNIDIVVNEIDALLNINFHTRTVAQNKRCARLLRLGTCGALQDDITLHSVLLSHYAVGLDNTIWYYKHADKALCPALCDAFLRATKWDAQTQPYTVEADESLVQLCGRIADESVITLTAPGFYGPQGRELRLPSCIADIGQRVKDFQFEGVRIGNFEMEMSALFGLSKLLGHQACGVSMVVANRAQKQESASNIQEAMDAFIQKTLQALTA